MENTTKFDQRFKNNILLASKGQINSGLKVGGLNPFHPKRLADSLKGAAIPAKKLIRNFRGLFSSLSKHAKYTGKEIGKRFSNFFALTCVFPVLPLILISVNAGYAQTSSSSISLNWESGITWADDEVGKLKDNDSTSVLSLLGNSDITKPTGSTISIAAFENRMPLTSSTSTETGYSNEYESAYGTWYWKADDSGFRFDPDWDAINPLGDNSNVSTTLQVKIVDSGTDLRTSTITLSLNGIGTTIEKVDADSTNNALKLRIRNFASTGSNYCVALQIFKGADLVASVHSPTTVGGTVPVIKTLDTYEVRTSGAAPTITITSVANASGDIGVALLNSDTDCGGESVTAASQQTVSHSFFGTSVVSINSLTKKEGDGSGSTLFQFTVSLTPATALNQTFTVPVAFQHITTDSVDFDGSTDPVITNVVFGSTDTSQTIDVMVNKDMSAEGDESFTLTISEPTGDAKNMNLVTLDTTPGANVGTGTITDDDRALVSIDDLSIAEGDGEEGTQFQFTVSLTPAIALNQTFTVPVAFQHITTDSEDFVDSTDPVIMNAEFGLTDTSKTINVMVNKDMSGEVDERFLLTISEPTGNAKNMNLVTLDPTPGANVGIGTITDDDFENNIVFSWDSGYDGTMIYDGISLSPSYILGDLFNSYEFASLYHSAIERKNNETVNSTNLSNWHDYLIDSEYPGFVTSLPSNFNPHQENRTGWNFTYGTWYRKGTDFCTGGFCAKFMFVPKLENFDEFSDGDVITSTYYARIVNNSGQQIDAKPITISITVDRSKSSVGIESESRDHSVIEGEIARIGVILNSAQDVPITIPYTITPGTALLDSDYRSSEELSVTIPAGSTTGTISIPTVHDLVFESNEEFTVSLSEGIGYTISGATGVATVEIIDDDRPRIRRPAAACHEVPKPDSVETPYTVAYWVNGAPMVDGEPVVYRRAGDPFNVRIGFRDPTDNTPEAHTGINTLYFAIYYKEGNPENPGIPKVARNNWGGVEHRIDRPRGFRGYLSYRILPRNTTGNDWYGVGDPCEFHIWWTDASKPGITMSIAQETVPEGKSFRVTATATPIPNRDILVPVTLSDASRITGPTKFNIRIRRGQASGHMDIPTIALTGDQAVDEVTASTEWRGDYWLDESKKSATITIQDHAKRIISFKDPEPNIMVNESGNAELVVNFDGANTSGVTVKYRIDNISTDAMDYTDPNNTEITIATGTEGTISIPISSDMLYENTESFTVTLIENDDVLPADSDIVATVNIISVNPPPMKINPGGERCDDVSQPQGTDTINTQARWKTPLPYIYQESNDAITPTMVFRNPTTRMDGAINMETLFKIGIYYLDGEPENNSDALGKTPTSLVDHIEFPLPSPENYTGFLNYRIDKSNETNNEWYDIATPCEIPIWWTTASKPGIALTIDKRFVVEGNSFKVTATATPVPNRDILVPITLSDTTRIDESQTYTIRVASGQPSGHIDVLTKSLTGNQSADDLTVSAEWRSTYWMDETVRSAEISISEDVVPALSISADTAVTEADTFEAVFTVTSDVDPGGDEVKVHYTPVETGNFFVAPVPDLATRTNNGHTNGLMTYTMLTFSDMSAAGDGSGPFESQIRIPLQGNTLPDTEIRTVTVTLNPDAEGMDYTVSTSNSNASASVQIIDDESLPVLTLESSDNLVEFDEPASDAGLTFKITASSMPLDAYPETSGTVEIDIHYLPVQTGNFIRTTGGIITPESPVKLTFAENGGIVTADLTITIAGDDIEESSGSVSVTLLAADTPAYYYKLGTEAEKNTHKVKIYDDDEPELSISISDSLFVEGDAAHIEFTVASRFNVTESLMVNYQVEEFDPSDPDTTIPSSQNEFLGTNTGSVALDFSTSMTQSLNISIMDDTTPESSDRSVRVTLLPGTDYSVAGADEGESAEIQVVDDDGKPLISISGPESVTEYDESIIFTVSAVVDPTAPITVNFSLSDDETEDYLTAAEEMRSSAVLTLEDDDSDGTFTDEITVNLDHDDGLADRTGEITLAITANTTLYRLGETSTATVIVYDDDAPELTISGGGPITEVDPPDSVTASFTVESQVLPNRNATDGSEGKLTVHYRPVSMNYLDSTVSGASTSAMLSFSDISGSGDGPYRAELNVPIQSDTLEEADGTIEVTLEDEATAGTSYYVVDSATGNHTASVAVTDDDSLLLLTVSGPVDGSGNPKGTAESEVAVVFIVTANKNPGNDITVAFDPANVGSASFVAESYSTDFPSQTQMHPTQVLSFTDNGSGIFTANLPVLLQSDSIKERTGEIMVTLIEDPKEDDEYKLGSTISANATVWDDDAPELVIEGLGTVLEQQDDIARFRVTARSRPSSGSLRVSFTATDSSQTNAGQFIDSGNLDNPQDLTFAPGMNTAILTVPIVNDGDTEEDGSITVMLTEETSPISAASYTVSADSSENTATVVVRDDELLPLLSIETAGTGEMAENDQVGTASFAVTATFPSGVSAPSSFSFLFTPMQVGDFIDDASGNFTPDQVETGMFEISGTGNTFTHMIEVPVDNDTNTETTGSISIEILTDRSSNAKYLLDSNKNVASVKVYDDEAPELSISVLPENLTVTEGSQTSVSFRVTAKVSPDEVVKVDYLPTETGGPYLQTSGMQSVDLDFSDGLTVVDFSVDITGNAIPNSDSVITVVLQDENPLQNYTVDSDNNTANITVLDDDTGQRISIVAPTQPVVESTDGTTANIVSFGIKSTGASSSMKVNYTVAEVGASDFLLADEEGDKSATLTFTDTDLVQEISVTLANDSVGERTGMVRVTITDPDNANDYRISDSTTEFPITAIATILDDDAPELSISAGEDVIESVDEFASFEISTQVMPRTSLSVSYIPISAGFLFPGVSGELDDDDPPLTFADTDGDGIYTATLNVLVHNDPVQETDGRITVTLADDDSTNPTYFVVDGSGNAASVNVKDDDSQPILSISGPESIAEYADKLVFTVTATAGTKPESNFRVFYTVSQDGSFLHSDHADILNGNTTSTELEFSGSAPTFAAELSFQLDDDEVGEDEGTVKVTINSVADGRTTYRVSASNQHTVIVHDDDRPVIWITALDENRVVNEGREVHFTVKSAVMPSTSPLLVRYRIADTDFIANSEKGEQTESLAFVEVNDEYTASLKIPLLESPAATLGTVVATLIQNSPVTYTVVTDDQMRSNSATIQVITNPEEPTVVISRAEATIIEGQLLRYSLRVLPAQTTPVSIVLKWSQDGDFVFSAYPQSISIPAGQSAAISVPTVDDNVSEDDGSVTLAVETTENYPTIGEGMVTIEDNDSNTTTQSSYSVASSVIRSILLEIPETGSSTQHQKTELQVTIASVSESIQEGESAEFVVATDQFAPGDTTIQIGLEQKGNFLIGPMNRSVTIAKGEIEVLFSIDTENDEVAEEDGQISSTILDGSGYKIGLQKTAHVAVSDAVDRQQRETGVSSAMYAVLPDMLAHSTTRTLDIAAERVTQAFSGSPASSIELNGNSPALTVLQSGGEMLNGNITDWRSVIDGSAFTVALYPEGGEISPATVWGVGDRWNLSGGGSGGQQNWDGETHSGHFGFDAQVGHGILAGLAMSVSQSEIGYGQIGDSEMSFGTMATAVHPYFGLSSPDGNSRIHILAGYGKNDLELKQEGYSPKILKSNNHTIGLGGSNRFNSIENFGGLSNLDLSVGGEAWYSQQSVDSVAGVVDNLQVNARHVRIAFEGSHDHHLEYGGAVSPSISVGLLGDGRNEETAFGLDIGNSIRFDTYSGLEFFGAGKTILFGLNRIYSWEIESSLDYDSGNDGKGVLFRMSPTWRGVDTSAERSIWGNGLADRTNYSNGSNDGDSMEIDIGYGFEVLDGSAIITPYSAFNQTGNPGSELQIGSRFATSTGFNFELGVLRDLSETGAIGHEFNLTGNINW